MNFMKMIKLASSSRVPVLYPKLFQNQPTIITRKYTSPCGVCLRPPEKRDCFDIKRVKVEYGTRAHAKMLRSFLYLHYWPREPSVVGLWMAQDSDYINVLSDKYVHSGDRFLAFEQLERTKECRLVGVAIANKVFPWMPDELEEWAHYTASKPERHRMYFMAHCLRSPNLFKKYKCDYIYDVEVLATASEVTGQGVATLLLRHALSYAFDQQFPVTQVVAVSEYTAKICEKCGMKREWSMAYTDFVDDAGQRVFFPRRPHHTVAVYTKIFNCDDIHKPTECLEKLGIK